MAQGPLDPSAGMGFNTHAAVEAVYSTSMWKSSHLKCLRFLWASLSCSLSLPCQLLSLKLVERASLYFDLCLYFAPRQVTGGIFHTEDAGA